MFIHQKPDWTDFKWDSDKILPLLGNVRHRQGKLIGRMESLGFSMKEEAMLTKAKFWEQHSQLSLNERQRLMLNKLFDGFEGKLTSSKWAKITKTSPDTALRDIQDLISKGILKKEGQGGRSTNYELAG